MAGGEKKIAISLETLRMLMGYEYQLIAFLKGILLEDNISHEVMR